MTNLFLFCRCSHLQHFSSNGKPVLRRGFNLGATSGAWVSTLAPSSGGQIRTRIEVQEQEILWTESPSRGFEILFPPTELAKGTDKGWGVGSMVGFAQDPIVLDLTMQCIVCPWLCQAPWRLVSAFLCHFWTPKLL